MRFVAVLSVLAMLCGGVRAEEKTVKVLSVGNSFSANAQRLFSAIVQASGHRTVAVNAMIGGCDFERHMRHADAFEANPADPQGRPYPGKKSLKELLTSEKWDFVTIQQASPKSFRPETFHPHADRLIAYIKKYAPQAEIVIHQTWAYRDDHRWFSEHAKYPDQPANRAEMYKRVRAAYDGLAKDTGFRLIPCGDAMELAQLDPSWGAFVPDPAFDAKAAVYPALPTNEKRSLHGGYGWKKNEKNGTYALGSDKFHANTQGEYLLGCVWLEFFFGQSAVGNTFVPKGMTAEDAAVLQTVAHRAVTEKQRPDVMPK
ncbi:MAG TPA: DUF4886 domain-containing protein [Kiritimatiellia bacterium]|nr:DUF4886 domain-containing protein [Kiritimatiellia bacterium]HPS07867.1 DUF4886 domain-containing protein [Kiritimatiellia bacterium]